MLNYIIVGTGGHGRTVLSYLTRSGISKDQIAFLDLFEKKQDIISGCQVIGGLMDEFESPFEKAGFVVAYGGSPYTGNAEREKASMFLEKRLGEKNSFVSVMDPSAIIIADAEIETNSSIGIASVIGTNSKIHKGVIVNNQVLIEHDVEIGAFSNISPGSMIMGGTSLGDRVFVGAGSILRDDISIGSDSVIGMGSVVTKDIPKRCLASGNPARVIRNL